MRVWDLLIQRTCGLVMLRPQPVGGEKDGFCIGNLRGFYVML